MHGIGIDDAIVCGHPCTDGARKSLGRPDGRMARSDGQPARGDAHHHGRRRKAVRGDPLFLHVRATEHDPWTSRPATAAEPILSPVFDGKTLRFMVSHKRAHPPGTLNDPPSHFHLTLLGPDKAGLVNETEAGPRDTGSGLPMVRSDY